MVFDGYVLGYCGVKCLLQIWLLQVQALNRDWISLYSGFTLMKFSHIFKKTHFSEFYKVLKLTS